MAGGDEAARRRPLSRHIPSSDAPPPRTGAGAQASPQARTSALDLFLPLLKVDLDRRLVCGVATVEAPDHAGEIGGLQAQATTVPPAALDRQTGGGAVSGASSLPSTVSC
jgi:hypothetical protein